ncbi:hypothetical protein AB0I16_27070 [Streptomyces sp. NPDC050703]
MLLSALRGWAWDSPTTAVRAIALSILRLGSLRFAVNVVSGP